MLIPILISAAVILVLLIVLVALRPSDFRVDRSQKLAASPAKAFEQVNDLRKMNAWNPWVKMDPNIKQTFDGPPVGVGASYSWEGNKNVGAGRQTIIESRPHELVRMKLEFFRPFPGVQEVQFTVVPEGDQSVVTWSLIGKLNFMMKVMGLFMSMDKMCGNSFEQGLAEMKSIVEANERVGERANPVAQY